ncbi:MAG: dolichyl-phosphate beta-glucosyltransferase [Candidatus Paceibacterota bacterium]|jgi:dolichyl-phosphate beta-glucosyltransferase
MNDDLYLSVILPAYNEEKLIRSTLNEVCGYLSAQNYTSEIIIVNDGSVDGTAKILDDIVRNAKNMKVINNPENRGKGYSVRRGMLEAGGKYRLFMDADNSTDIKEIKKFLELLEGGVDAVIGDRTLENSVILLHQPTYKKILGNIGNVFIRSLTVPGIKDTQCGFKCFTGKLVRDVFPVLGIDRWAFDVEILALALKRGYRIKNIPVVWKNRSESKVKVIDYVLTFADLVRIKINLLTNKYERAK